MLIAVSTSIVHCYSPTITTGLPCSESDECPNGQECFQGTCDVGAGTVDAAGFTAIDANAAPDAMVDATVCPAGSQTFSATGAIESFAIPDCVTMLTIEGLGAQGGGGRTDPTLGGKGARIRGEFRVNGGDVLQILVGQRGFDAQPANTMLALQHAGGSGGGGSFVVDSSDVPLIVAGGGGGATDHSDLAPTPGGLGQITTTAQGIPIALGGQNGLGGDSTSNPGGFHTGTGGGGFFGDGKRSSDGSTANYGAANQPGVAFLNGGLGGLSGALERDGGFGGGGAAGFTGGGGGGYSGGGGGGFQANLSGGGGGGSFNTGEKQENTVGVNTGDGVITLSW